MKYTAGELRKMNGRKCKLQYGDKPEAEWEIYVVDSLVSFVTNNDEYCKWTWMKRYWYNFSWLLHRFYDNDSHSTTQYNSITFLDEQNIEEKNIKEPHQNIYHDDNGEIIKEWDRVLVSNNGHNEVKRIFLCKVPRREFPYICVNDSDIELYRISKESITASGWCNCIKYKEPEKKLRELMLTDEEYEEVKNKYK